MNPSKPRILLLSDLWGYRHDQWRTNFEQSLITKYQLHYLDSTKIAGISANINNQEALHRAFLKGGVEKAVQYLGELKETYHIIIGISIGGTIAWQALLNGFCADRLIAISATRLRYETTKPDCLIDLYYGAEDRFKPNDDWFQKLKLNATFFSGKEHHIYKEPTIVQTILNKY